ncbi:fructose-6-phosphate aldolase [Megasphaera paucivorans]|uniref:Probable transaldolase n=1 Tax=Megasphaera paucivorans TaxID=349095 RepID=A0A1G9TD19_9FIRM|nr:fructose-6-phosphate aldolase [Megasphaera paucivorans]SDM45567.1 transaldolase [Megasphaera paucivorans]
MKFFIDTANVEEIKAAYEMGVICGVTTNPSLVAKEGRDFHEVIKEITAIVNGPVSAEVLADDAQGMIKEAKVLAALDEHVVVKIPMTAEGLKAVAALHMLGIQTNVTLVFSANQALMAARAGASYVSPFVGRLEDIGQDGIALIAEIADIFAVHGIATEIIAASIRRPTHITECAKAGANIATVPYKIIMQALHHPLTDAGIKRFKEDWAEANQ